MWTLFLLIPTLLMADVELVAPVVTPAESASVTVYQAPAAKTFDLHLKPSVSSAVVAKAPESELASSAQDTGLVTDNMRWMSVERPVKLTGFVDKSAINKNLDIAPGTLVWQNEEKTVQLTAVDNPSSARLLEVDRMGKIEVTEPRVLYYGVPMAVTAPAPVADDTARWQANTSARRGEATSSADSAHRMIEGTLRKGSVVFGSKLYLVDARGQHICKIDPRSPIATRTLQQYIDRTAVFVGELHEANGTLILSVRSVRMR